MASHKKQPERTGRVPTLFGILEESKIESQWFRSELEVIGRCTFL